MHQIKCAKKCQLVSNSKKAIKNIRKSKFISY